MELTELQQKGKGKCDFFLVLKFLFKIFFFSIKYYLAKDLILAQEISTNYCRALNKNSWFGTEVRNSITVVKRALLGIKRAQT